MARQTLGIGQIENRVLRIAQLHALITRRQETAAPVVIVKRLIARALHFGNEHEVVRQVLIQAAEPVTDPRAHAGPTGKLMPGQKLRHGRRVIDLIRRHRLDEAQIVRHALEMRQPFADRRAAPAAAAEFRDARQDELLLVRRHRRQPLALAHRFRQFLARPLHQARFVVKQLQLRRPARLREKNHPLRLRREMRKAGQAGRFPLPHRLQRHRADRNAGALAEEVAAGGGER